MNFISKYYTPAAEKVIFSLFLLFSLFCVWRSPYFISLDGPAHIYNASLLNIIKNSSFLQQYLSYNTFFLPNYLSHFILSKLLTQFEAATAEKLLISSIILFLPLTFRSVVVAFTRHTPYYSFLIFPLVFTSLLHHGFYNFSMGFIFFNLHLILITKLNAGKTAPLTWSLILLNSLFLYYCHAFAYAIALLVNLVYLIVNNFGQKKDALKLVFLSISVHLPTILFYIIFSRETTVTSFDYDFKPFEKCRALMNFYPGIVFDIDNELPYATVISALLIFLSAYVIALRSGSEKKLQTGDLYLVLTLLLIYLIFHTTDGSFGGMFVQRLYFLTFYFLIIWLCLFLPDKKTLCFVTLLITIYSFGHLAAERNKVIQKAQPGISEVRKAGTFIKDRSVVQVIILTDTWFQRHLSNYLSINREVVLLENYEASLAWFPLTWSRRVQDLKASNDTVDKLLKPDYIFVYGKKERFSEGWQDTLKAYSTRPLTKVYESSDEFCKLYSVSVK